LPDDDHLTVHDDHLTVTDDGGCPTTTVGRGRFRVHCAAMSRSPLLLACALAAVGLTACDDPPKPAGDAASATATAAPPTGATPAPTSTDRPKPTTMPELIVDPDGPYLGGYRVNLGDAAGAEKLTKIVKDLPINGKAVTLQVDKKAKISSVAAVVTALGDAGAPRITIKTEGRNDLPKELTVTPESRLSSAPACSIVVSVLKDLSTAVWPLKGAQAKKQRKGLAGPDLSHTGETLEKDLAACDSTTAFFSGDDSVGWESVFNLAGTVLVSDKKKRLETFVLLSEEPVAGRAVTLRKH
jgi:biopolymer transport protein ExbD